MLKKTFRLSSSKDIRVTSLRGRSFFSPYFVIKFRPATTVSPRFSIIASARVSKLAVERNRIKRIVREALRLTIGKFRPGDYVIIVKVRAAKQPAAVIRKELEQLLVNVRLKTK